MALRSPHADNHACARPWVSDDLRHDPGKAEGRAEARAEGKAEGRIEGERTTAIAALLDVYTARFGEPPDSLTEELPRRDIPTLRALFPLFATGSREKILAHLS